MSSVLLKDVHMIFIAKNKINKQNNK